MEAINQGTLLGFCLSLKGNAWLKIHAWWSDELYAIRSTLSINHKHFLEHFLETTNFSPNTDCYKHFTTFNCFYIVWNLPLNQFQKVRAKCEISGFSKLIFK